MNNSKETKKSGLKRTLIEWGAIGAVIALLYATGLHTPVIGAMQRAMLWTGLFDADISEIDTTEGAFLSDSDFDFLLEDVNGNRVSLSEFKGDIIFINVWASWCPPCIAEMPTIETLHENVDSRENIRFILLSMDEQRQKAVDFIENREIEVPYYFPASPLPGKLHSPYLPTTYVLSKEGQIIYKKEGIADYSSMNFARWMIELAEN